MHKLKNIFWILLIIGLVGTFGYKIVKRSFTDHWLKTDAVLIKAVIIDERNYPPNQPIMPEWSYSYLFVANGKLYTNNAHDPALKVGDSVEIEYVKGHPELNRPLHPQE